MTQYAEPFSISFTAASKHAEPLENAGLIRREVRGRIHPCRLDFRPLASAHDRLSFHERVRTDRLDLLRRLFRDDEPDQSPALKGDDE